MVVKLALPSNRAALSHQMLPDVTSASKAPELAKVERFLEEMAKFEEEQRGKYSSNDCGFDLGLTYFFKAKARASAPIVPPNPIAIGKPMCTYELPLGSQQISSSLKIDDPPTPLRIGHITTFFKHENSSTNKTTWFGLTWAETFFPAVGDKPKSVVGNKAYEVVLKQSFKDGGMIVRENVATTGRVIGVVTAELPHETVSVMIEDWFVKSDVFKTGCWEHRNPATPAT